MDSPLCDVVSPLRGVVSSLYDWVSPLCDVLSSSRSCPALQIGIPQDTDNGCDVIVVLLIRLPPNLDSGLTS